jgi:TldD protein
VLLTASATSALKAGLRAGEYGEVRTERTRITGLVWRGDGPESAATHQDDGCCARVSGPAGSSFASSTEPDLSAVVRQAGHSPEGLLAAAMPLAQGATASGEYRCAAGEAAGQVSLAEKAQILGGYHSAARAAHPRVTGALVYYRECLSEIELTTSDGTSVWYERRDLTLQITVYAGTGASRTAGSVSVGSGGDFSVVRGLGEQIGAAAATAVDVASAPVAEPGDYDVVCDGQLAGIWAHETIGHLAEADHHLGDPDLQQALRPGRRIGPDALTITDGPGQPGARGYVPVDDEGVPGQEVTLLRDGIVAAPRVHDRTTAEQFAEAPTGNGRALSFRYPPLPRLRTTAVAPGTASVDELIAGVDNGILARGVLGGQTDRLGFTFLPAECRVIRDGRSAGLIRGVVLSGSVLDAFASIDAVGSGQWRGDTSASCGKQGQYPLAVSSWAPALRLRGIRVRTG